MSEAHNLFEYQGCNTKILAHRNDPTTSREAAEKMVKFGALNKQEEAVYYGINRIPGAHLASFGFTAKDLADWSKIDYFKIQRRLSGLHSKGKIIRTGDKRDGCCVWRLT